MSYNDKMHMAMGYRVRHAYKRIASYKGHPVCTLCGVKRRKTSSGWEYLPPLTKQWTSSNPPCVKKDAAATSPAPNDLKDASYVVVTGETTWEAPNAGNSRVYLRPGILLRFAVKQVPDEDQHPLGTLWIWKRSPEEHYLMQASHVTHVHRIQAIFWHPTMANLMREQLLGKGIPELSVYTTLREAGLIPPPEWRGKRS